VGTQREVTVMASSGSVVVVVLDVDDVLDVLDVDDVDDVLEVVDVVVVRGGGLSSTHATSPSGVTAASVRANAARRRGPLPRLTVPFIVAPPDWMDRDRREPVIGAPR
jgi:hypothetical protein